MADHTLPINNESQGRTGLVLAEDTIFDRSSPGRTGFELPPLEIPRRTPVRYARETAAELPEVGELDVVRHFTRLSSWNYSIDLGTFPLGSCTMKYNPRINEEIAATAGMSEIHPETPPELCQGALEVIYRVEKLLCDVSGLDECSVQPAAGAHGEFTGLLLIRAFHEKHGSSRKLVLIPDIAHGTNPASCVLAGYQAVTLKSNAAGIVPVEAVAEAIEKYGRDIAAFMATNPNTAGLFEANIVEIAELIHGIGAQMYMDGANMNAIMGVAKPRDMGIDVMQYNLHKTFSTPHGGGGPGAGPVAVKSHLAPYLPGPRVRLQEDRFVLETPPESIGKVKGSLGNFGVVVRALTYILSHGSDGLKRVTRTAVLNANYIRQRLSEYYQAGYSTPNFHECLLTDARQQKEYGVKTINIAKALIDEGYAPPTIYFPLVVAGAMLIEPTETESLQDLDKLAAAFIRIAKAIEAGEKFEHAPSKTIVEKVDEVGAARRPVLSLDDRGR
jgi:glycine dehydrogenase subunit 2